MTKRKPVLKGLLELLYVLLLVFCLAAIIAFPDRYLKTTADGLKIWALTVLPALLPFFFLTALLTKTGVITELLAFASAPARILYGADGIAVYIQIMSFLSGYPIGAKIVADLYDRKVISARYAEKLSVTSSTSSPSFIVGSVGAAMFASKKTGLVLLVSHIASSIICGVLLRRLNGGERAYLNAPQKENNENVLYESAFSSVLSVAIVGAFIALFYTFANVLIDAKVLSPAVFFLEKFLGKDVAEGLIVGLIECTTGLLKISAVPASALSVAISCAVITLGGLSVWCQSIIYLKKAKVRVKIFITAKFLQAAIAFLTSFALFYIF